MCILDGKLYAELDPGSETDGQLEACMLLANSQGKELLAPGKGAAYGEDRKVVMPLREGKARRAWHAWSPGPSLMLLCSVGHVPMSRSATPCPVRGYSVVVDAGRDEVSLATMIT